MGIAADDVKSSVTLDFRENAKKIDYTNPMKRPQITTITQNARDSAP
jgi:hypothetical protein